MTELAIPGQARAFGFYRGRVAMSALLRGLDLPARATVAIQGFTCRAVPDALTVSGFIPEYIDIEAGGVNMSPTALEATVSSSTRVVIVQHTFGIPAAVDEIARFCRDTDRVLIEDCCHSVTSTLGGRLVGTFGLGGFTSFEWGKEVIAGVGGAAWANTPEAAHKLGEAHAALDTPSRLAAARQFTQWAAFRALYRPSTYWHLKTAFATLSRTGAIESNAVPEAHEDIDASQYSLRMHPTAQRRAERALNNIREKSAHRRAMSEAFATRVVNPSVRPVLVPAGARGGWVRHPLLVEGKDQLLIAARQQRVELADWYVSAVDPLGPENSHVVHYRPGSCPEAEERASEIVTLPTVGSPDSAHSRRAVELLQKWGRS